MKKRPATLRPMDEAPKDGTIIDLWRDDTGWVRDVWFDPAFAIHEEPDGWVTICPRPFVGWRPAPGVRMLS